MGLLPLNLNHFLFLKKIICPPKLSFAVKHFRKKRINVLDIGCGNFSYYLTKKWLRINHYTGVDKEYWHDEKESYEGIDDLRFIDLDEPDALDQISNDFYDYIIFNHVIEHLPEAEDVLKAFLDKLKKGGFIYIETPSLRTINYPSANGFLNFYDENTHKRAYPIPYLITIMMSYGFKIKKYGVRRDIKRIIIYTFPMLLYNIFYSIPFKRRLDSRGLWDFLGVSEFLIAYK